MALNNFTIFCGNEASCVNWMQSDTVARGALPSSRRTVCWEVEALSSSREIPMITCSGGSSYSYIEHNQTNGLTQPRRNANHFELKNLVQTKPLWGWEEKICWAPTESATAATKNITNLAIFTLKIMHFESVFCKWIQLNSTDLNIEVIVSHTFHFHLNNMHKMIKKITL